jgi:protein AaeX
VTGEFDIYGVYFPAFAVFAAIALVHQLAIKRLFDASGLYNFIWHRALFDLAIYVHFACHRHGGRREHSATRMRA